MKYNEEKKDILEAIKRKKGCYIYGCGMVGRLVLNWLKGYGIQPEAFLVSDEPKDELVECLQVKQISQMVKEINGDFIILVATTEKYHFEIRKRLEDSTVLAEVLYMKDDFVGELKKRIKVPRKQLCFQIHLVEHCNLNCRGCYHFSSIAEEECLDIEEYKKDILRLSDLFEGNMERILLLGGEPLLHPEIDKFILETRNAFPNGSIQILTNGILLNKMTDDFFEACKDTNTELWVTKYPIKIDYNEIENYTKNKGVELHYFNKEPVRTLGHQPLSLNGEEDAIDNFETCYRANDCILLDHGKMYTCLVPAEVKHFNKFFCQNLKVEEQDYVNIYEVETGQALLDRLCRPIPFCRYCNRSDISVFGRIPWQVTKKDINEWTV